MRYHLLGECMEKHGFTKAALGHHKDDQAETVLLHLIRGSRLPRLAGMKPNGTVSSARCLSPRNRSSATAVLLTLLTTRITQFQP